MIDASIGYKNCIDDEYGFHFLTYPNDHWRDDSYLTYRIQTEDGESLIWEEF